MQVHLGMQQCRHHTTGDEKDGTRFASNTRYWEIWRQIVHRVSSRKASKVGKSNLYNRLFTFLVYVDHAGAITVTSRSTGTAASSAPSHLHAFVCLDDVIVLVSAG